MNVGSEHPSVRGIASLEPFSRGEDVRIWRPAHLPGVELMTAVHSDRLWRVFHESYAVCMIPRREGLQESEITYWRYRGRQDVMRPGTVALLEPGEVHANIRNYRAADFYVFFFDPMILAGAAQELSIGGPVHWRMARTESPTLGAAIGDMYAALAADTPPLEQESRLAACVRMLVECCGERRPAPAPAVHPGVRRVRDYLHAHVLDPVRLEQLAALSGLSRFHLAHTFTRMYGLPPHAYHNELRVAFVRRQLKKRVPLPDIEAGFFDQSHLIRYFKRSVGVTPARYASPPTGPLPRFA